MNSKLKALALALRLALPNAAYSMGDTMENSTMLLLFNNTNIANIGDAVGLRGSTVAGSFYIAFHTADPGDAGSAITNETAYTGYARVAVARAAGASGFTVTGNSVSPASNCDAPKCTAAPGGNLTHFSVVNTSSGAGFIIGSGVLSPNIAMAIGVIPRLETGTTITLD